MKTPNHFLRNKLHGTGEGKRLSLFHRELTHHLNQAVAIGKGRKGFKTVRRNLPKVKASFSVVHVNGVIRELLNNHGEDPEAMGIESVVEIQDIGESSSQSGITAPPNSPCEDCSSLKSVYESPERTAPETDLLSVESFAEDPTFYDAICSVPIEEMDEILGTAQQGQPEPPSFLEGPTDYEDYLRRLARREREVGLVVPDEGNEIHEPLEDVWDIDDGKPIDFENIESPVLPRATTCALVEDGGEEGKGIFGTTGVAERRNESKTHGHGQNPVGESMSGTYALLADECEKTIEEIKRELGKMEGDPLVTNPSPEDLAYYSSIQLCQCNACVMFGSQDWVEL